MPVYKNLDPLQKENYRPVSLLPHISKVFERVIYKQINNFMENKISKCITGFRKSHGTQHSLTIMLVVGSLLFNLFINDLFLLICFTTLSN